MEPRSEWKRGTFFARAARALGVPVNNVMAQLGENVVLYTPEGMTEIWCSTIVRDDDGSFIAGNRRFVCTEADFHRRMEALVEEAMEGEGHE